MFKEHVAEREYENFDGFVVLHGTDTLAYTASALSFMTENLGKPIVITGSQIPLFETRSDGKDNFIGSVIVAGLYPIPEVTVFFNNKLYRGNRTVKVSTGSLDAFDSPNLSPLAVAGISIQGIKELGINPYVSQILQQILLVKKLRELLLENIS
ncbi:L-asparaginase 1 [Armadillidium vulgare]|nr:L-asparaginase 1 [Armadillidium vulgare]